MALEDRVKQLEDEIKVLKNEIQQTLLEIKEQVLLNRYPSLHSAAQNGASAPEAQEPSRPAAAEIAKKYKTNIVILQEEEDEQAAELPAYDRPSASGERPAPPPRQTSPPAPPAQPQQPPPPPPPEPIEPSSQAGFPATRAGNGNSSGGDALPRSSRHLSREDEDFLDSLNADDLGIGEEHVSFDEVINRLPNRTYGVNDAEDDLELFDELFLEAFPFVEKPVVDKPAPRPAPPPMTSSPKERPTDLPTTVRRLLSWIDASVTILGREKAAQAIDLYARTGELPDDLKKAILDSIRNSPLKSEGEKAPGIKRVIDHLSELNELLDNHSPEYLSEVLALITEVNSG